ncbi:S-adenosyl-L-methionine-dependent methyltransferase [Parathielavia hyrcaniae]|uniref:Protein-lysine N-methyltransferase EFM4 n=1 Tax=Parathielavia hyrcaniae TaxID=113614 RepID=A0AAN6Q9T1_9PEZI|nr:S-adenosyl-L-methionine-dependent methyltransferase [Parathielavia hyrcaniae]
MPEPATPPHLDPSALGTKEYWDKLYEKELSNHADNPADQGTVWFDDSDAEAKIVAFLGGHHGNDDGEDDDDDDDDEDEKKALGSGSENLGLDRRSARVLDLGCGNGSLLFALRDDGWRGELLGVDYSARSVELARRVAVARELEREVEFRVWDVLNGPLSDINDEKEESKNTAGWDLVLDKGTFDAVSLSDERDAHGRRICEGYGERVLQLLRQGGIFLVTSCNWTEAELREWFESKTQALESGARLRLAGRIQYPSFSFGGVKGQTISTLCFEKVGGR